MRRFSAPGQRGIRESTSGKRQLDTRTVRQAGPFYQCAKRLISRTLGRAKNGPAPNTIKLDGNWSCTAKRNFTTRASDGSRRTAQYLATTIRQAPPSRQRHEGAKAATWA